MYQFFSDISNLISNPFINLANQWEGIPLLAALFLGIVGAVAPCQFTSNIGAMTLYGNRSLQKDIPWTNIWLFVLGKVVVFSILGLFVWLIGREFHASFTQIIPIMRKAIGPIIVLIGIFMVGFIRMRWTFNIWKIPERYLSGSKVGSFILGVSFTLAFCPTMFILFFMMLMPIVLSTSYGAVLPLIFGLGTSIPFLSAIFLIWYFDLGGKFMKQSKKFGEIVHKLAGWILIILGILDTMTYW
ncbi:urease accessory protein UreH domain-containing protein [Salirhabdus salicampi]|uniref:urease accessory protein UreH domain-containing protein n=1 Tax=Salirhabdus salicampi TaxID=476102 RepID=UPI0020C440B0|nr:sulfite exporter TauE/SafE family protein [Salirhabdus salicampi]MCP8616345.1 sulfite exporter TauE/SafE family protein [Salirhabdus salicampi]